VREWMLLLMARQAVTLSVDDVKAQVALSLPAMTVRFPAEAFCAESLDAIAGTERYWNEAGVSKALDAWWKAHQPALAALPQEAEDAPLDMPGKQWVAYFYRATDDAAAALALSLIQAKDAAAYGYLLRTSATADSIARERDWRVPLTHAELAYEWDDPERIKAAFGKVLGMRGRILDERHSTAVEATVWGVAYTALVTAVRIHAPRHLHLLDPAQLREVREPVPPIVALPPVVTPEAGLFGD
jgi:hypothetical protein